MAETRKVKVNLRSGFDKHFRNTLTAHCGTLVPVLFDELIPNSKVYLKLDLAASLPPLVSDTYMNVRLHVDAFAVPHRLLMGNFEDFFCDFPAEYLGDYDSSGPDAEDVSFDFVKLYGAVPLIQLDDDDSAYYEELVKFEGVQSLCDYLGWDQTNHQGPAYFNILPFVAYHLIWQEWYRNPRVQRPAFMKFPAYDIGVVPGADTLLAVSLPYTDIFFDSVDQPTIKPVSEEGVYPLLHYLLADGKNILELRQRNFDLDYFTGAMVDTQQGPKAKVTIVDGAFTIESLRAENSIQQFRERNNLTSPRYQQQNYARYGVAPSDGVLQRPALIGHAEYDVYSHGVTQTSNGSDGDSSNPFGSYLGCRGGNGFAAGSDMLIKGFHTKEPMYLMVLISLVPDVTYSQGVNPILRRYIGMGSISDMANGILQNVGPDVIRTSELYAGSRLDTDPTFAYKDRYADWMIMKNQAHGHFKTGSDLSSFILQRSFSDVPEFGSEFLEIPTSYLDDVLQLRSDVMGFAYWVDMMLEYKVSMPLQEYSIPSLQDPGYEHGRTISLRKNGQLL